MSGRILIVDAVPTNRIVLRVKMLAAQFAVEACASSAEARALIAKQRPDLILVNLSDPAEDRHGFCTALKADPDTSTIAIIAVGTADTSRARFAALDAGADDVLARPINDALLLARIRSLLRARSVTEELLLRDSTSRALGFCDDRASFASTGRITVITPEAAPMPELICALNAGLGDCVVVQTASAVLRHNDEMDCPDLLIIPATAPRGDAVALFGLVSDLRSRVDTRLASLLVMVPDGHPEAAAMFLDLGADDVVMQNALPQEMILRAKALVRRKQLHDALRRNVLDGLQAAVTDPLTGLLNRRYVDHHLARMSEQSTTAGSALAVMMIDIDHFKAINDTYGHPAGDRVLIALAARLRDNLRAVDLVARIGGEEFLIAMPRTTAKQAQGAADRLRRLVSQTPFDLGAPHDPIAVTISVGVALSGEAGQDQPDTHRICDLADAALYRAKSAGRDCVAMDLNAA
ncbi:diguanylate cyclase domain-containing protein [Yoonia vestfoldensis]|uniref:diguanylate cyclase n=1 Tax=Yoonia vestfoldensis TaxID=245188 RepID=A0A1Y0EDI5_9RHOB|nr:diguanylate cyclase [Yoonia vestfoldensis]ARU01489.1 response regulator PleD [Yoonia vestfoldensis]